MAIDKNKILATESQVAEICASNGMALTAGALTWNGTFDNLYRVPIGSEDDMDFGFIRVTEEVPDDFSVLITLQMGVPTFFGVASALSETIYQSIEIMPEADSEGIYLYSYDGMDMPLAIIACEGNAQEMPAGVYFLYASTMDKAIMYVASMRLPSYAFKSNNYFVTEQNIIEIPNQSAYYWDGDYNNAVKQGVLDFGGTPLTFYSKYVGECDLTFEELANKRVIGIYKDGTECIIHTRIHDNYMELYPMTFFALSSVFITKEANVQVNEYITLAEPGVHFICINYPTVPALTYIDIEDSVHTLCSTNKTQVIQKSHLPEYLQLGDINETYTMQKLVGEATNNLGETLYWDANNVIDTGDMTRECRVADAIEIPANTVITGVHNETGKTINLVIVDNKIWASDNVPTNGTSPNSGYYAIIRKTGIYLCNFGSGGGSSSAYGSYLSSITFSGMNFTKTIYNIESEKIETTEFKTLDKKYLPEISYKDLTDKSDLIDETIDTLIENGQIGCIYPDITILEETECTVRNVEYEGVFGIINAKIEVFEGDEVTVFWNDKEYHCIVSKNSAGNPCIGNRSLIPFNREDIDSKEPFVLIVRLNQNIGVWVKDNIEGIYKIRIIKHPKKTINPKFFPAGGIGYTQPEVYTKLYEFQLSSNGYYERTLDTAEQFSIKKNVEILWLNIDGKRYECTFDISADTIRLECWRNCPFQNFDLEINSETEDSYTIGYIQYESYKSTTSPISLEILESEEIIHTIDSKYLPKNIVESINVVESVAEVTITSIYTDGTNSICTITKDSNGNPASVAINEGTLIPITWTEADV